jgi:hypothetical protein
VRREDGAAGEASLAVAVLGRHPSRVMAARTLKTALDGSPVDAGEQAMFATAETLMFPHRRE